MVVIVYNQPFMIYGTTTTGATLRERPHDRVPTAGWQRGIRAMPLPVMLWLNTLQSVTHPPTEQTSECLLSG